MAKVTHKDKGFTGRVLGVKFEKGVAEEVHLPGHLSYFSGKEGFTVKGEADIEVALKAPVENPGAGE